MRLSFDLDTLEAMLYSSCGGIIADQDVPILIKLLCESKGVAPPTHIVEAVEAINNEANGVYTSD